MCPGMVCHLGVASSSSFVHFCSSEHLPQSDWKSRWPCVNGGVVCGIQPVAFATSAYALFRIWFFIKRRSRVLRRRTRQAALDKPRVHDGQLGFAVLEQKKAAETAENRAFEEKQPLVFYRKPRIHGFMVE